jgi:hypothetical protein
MFSAEKAEPKRTSDWLLDEEDEIGRYSREIISLAPNQGVVKTGTPLSVGAGAGSVVYDNATAGATVVNGILVDTTDTGTGSAVKAVAIVRHAIVVKSGLTWGALGNTAKDSAMADLLALGVVERRAA